MRFYYACRNGREFRATITVNSVVAFLQVFLNGQRVYYMYYDDEKHLWSKLKNYPAKGTEWKEWKPDKMRRRDWSNWNDYEQYLKVAWERFKSIEPLEERIDE